MTKVQVSNKPASMDVGFESLATSVATGSQSFPVDLSLGTYRVVKEVNVYIDGAAAGASWKPAVGSTASNTDLTTDVLYYNAVPSIDFVDDLPASTSGDLVMKVNTGATGAKNVYTVVKYYYK